MQNRINEVIHNILEYDTAAQASEKLGVSVAMVSTWKNKDNDFTPRLPVAQRIYNEYQIQVWPYSLEALQGK